MITLQRNLAELQRISPADLAPVGCFHQQFVNGPSTGVPGFVDPNPFPFAFVVNAAFHDLTQWVDFNIPPPRAGRIDVDTSTTPPTVVRDAFGNALGGVRTPFLDVPTATYFPTDTVAHTTAFSGFCILYGYSEPFEDAMLDSLYRNHGEYVARVVRDSFKLVGERFWLLPDAIDVITRAAHAPIP